MDVVPLDGCGTGGCFLDYNPKARAESCRRGIAGEPAASCVDTGSVCCPSLCKSTASLEWGGAHRMAEFRLARQCCLHCSPLPSENPAAEFILLPFCLLAIPFNDCLYREMPKRGQRGQEMLLSGMCNITFSSNFDKACKVRCVRLDALEMTRFQAFWKLSEGNEGHCL